MIAAIPGAIDSARAKIHEKEMARLRESILIELSFLSRNEKIESEVKSKILANVYFSQTEGEKTKEKKDGIHLSIQDSAKFINLVMGCGIIDKNPGSTSQLNATIFCGESKLSNDIRIVGNPYKSNVYIIGEKYYAIASNAE